MLNKLNRHTDAEIITEALITRFPENEDVWLDHSDISFIKEDFLEALTRLNEGWQKNPQSTALGYRKVAYLHAAGQHVEADDLLLRMMMNDFSGAEELEEYYPEIKSNLLYIDLKKQLGTKE
jgi:predicted Zn-dependent protease